MLTFSVDEQEKIKEIAATAEIFSSRGKIVVVGCSDKLLIKEVEKELLKHLAKNHKINRVTSSWRDKNILRKILNLSKGVPKDTIFFAHGIENAKPEIFEYLNYGREVFSDIKRPVIIWTTEEMVDEIREKAIDFWALARSSTFRFVMDEEKEKVLRTSFFEHIPAAALANDHHYEFEKLQFEGSKDMEVRLRRLSHSILFTIARKR